MLQANVDPKEWLLEVLLKSSTPESPRVDVPAVPQVERVSSRLKVTMPNDSKEWRSGFC